MKLVKIVKKSDNKKCDNRYDDLLDGLYTLTDLEFAKKTLPNLSDEELRAFEWTINKAISNGKKLIPLIKQQIKSDK